MRFSRRTSGRLSLPEIERLEAHVNPELKSRQVAGIEELRRRSYVLQYLGIADSKPSGRLR